MKVTVNASKEKVYWSIVLVLWTNCAVVIGDMMPLGVLVLLIYDVLFLLCALKTIPEYRGQERYGGRIMALYIEIPLTIAIAIRSTLYMHDKAVSTDMWPLLLIGVLLFFCAEQIVIESIVCMAFRESE